MKLTLLLVIVIITWGCARSVDPPPTPVEAPKYLVGAYYNLWYPEAFNGGYLREKLTPPQLPAIGEYSSNDVTVSEGHISLASRYGVDFFALDFWPGWTTFEERIDVFLGAKNIDDIKFCIFYETVSLGYSLETGSTLIDERDVIQFVDEMERIGQTFFEHPSYLKVNGRPVVVLYLTRTLYGRYPEAIAKAREVWKKQGHDVLLIGDEIFWEVTPEKAAEGKPHTHTEEPQIERIALLDGITAYNFYLSVRESHRGYGSQSDFLREVNELTQRYADATKGDTPILPSVIPGYNDRGFRLAEDHYAIPRSWSSSSGPTTFFEHMLRDYALEWVDSRLPIIFITSWNEWCEDTAIEPLAESTATARDESGKQTYSEGYSYHGYDKALLESLQNQVVAVSGRVTNPSGDPVAYVPVFAWVEESCYETLSDNDGYYRFSRLSLDGKESLIGLRKETSVHLNVMQGRTTTMDFQTTTPAKPRRSREESFWDYVQQGAESETLESPSSALADLVKSTPDGTVVVEVGAGYGGATLALSALVGSSGRVHAFEPRREKFRQLWHNLRASQIRNVKASPTLPGHTTTRVGRYNEQFPIRPLDELALENCSLLLIDLPYYEHQVLEGARATIQRETPRIIIHSTSKRTLESVTNLIKPLGYGMKIEGDWIVAEMD